jgi:hypothetical protein
MFGVVGPVVTNGRREALRSKPNRVPSGSPGLRVVRRSVRSSQDLHGRPPPSRRAGRDASVFPTLSPAHSTTAGLAVARSRSISEFSQSVGSRVDNRGQIRWTDARCLVMKAVLSARCAAHGGLSRFGRGGFGAPSPGASTAVEVPRWSRRPPLFARDDRFGAPTAQRPAGG